MDVPRMALCLPGVERIIARGPDEFEGLMRVRVGPVALALEGTVTVVERDRAAWRASIRADASEQRSGGGLRATAHMQLKEAGERATRLLIETDARLLGRLGEFGQPLIRRRAQSMIAEFARNIELQAGDLA